MCLKPFSSYRVSNRFRFQNLSKRRLPFAPDQRKQQVSSRVSDSEINISGMLGELV